MRLVRTGFWIAVVVVAIYVAVVAIAGYVRAVEAVESAIESATRWQKMRPSADTAMSTTAVRDEVAANVRRQGIPVDPAKLHISQAGRRVSIDMRWAQPIFTVADETVLAVPLRLSRTVEVQ